MNPKRMLAAGAIAGSVVVGAGAGALMFTPTISSAQSTTTAPSETDDAGGRSVLHHRGPGLEVAAEAIGITEDELATELRSGKSIADVAKANDVDVQKVIDALVAEEKARLEEAQETLTARVTERVNSTGGLKGGPGGLVKAGLDTVATAIGISETDLRTELRAGKTIAQVAEAHDVAAQKVIDAIVAASTKAIDEAVAKGTITEERAADLKEDLEERATSMVNETHPGRGRGPGRGGPGPV
jgi:polyhydroxyalkanoate synthesis regulator phasin